MKENFKLNLYFAMYKDFPISSRDYFRSIFVKRHGKFNYLPELMLMIEDYQREKFGAIIWQDIRINYRKKGRY